MIFRQLRDAKAWNTWTLTSERTTETQGVIRIVTGNLLRIWLLRCVKVKGVFGFLLPRLFLKLFLFLVCKLKNFFSLYWLFFCIFFQYLRESDREIQFSERSVHSWSVSNQYLQHDDDVESESHELLKFYLSLKLFFSLGFRFSCTWYSYLLFIIIISVIIILLCAYEIKESLYVNLYTYIYGCMHIIFLFSAVDIDG